MRYLSLFSGIEAASVAWSPLGWSPAAFAEIEAFPSAVLKHRYPNVPNLGDVTKFEGWPDLGTIDLLVGGSPCQSFSVAGLRAGLADPRGNLMLTYLAIAAKYRPQWLVWENVPGVLSSGKGRDFATLLGGLGELGYGFAYRVLDAQFCRTLGFAGAVPQRRRRVFVIGHLGDWRRAAAVLFDAASLRGDSPPRRQAGKAIAPTISARPTGGGGLGTDFDLDGGLIPDISVTLTARDYKGPLQEADRSTVIAHALRADGFDASEDGTGRGTPLVPVVANYSNPQSGDPMHPLPAHGHPPAVAFGWQNSSHQGDSVSDSVFPSLDKSKTPAVQSGWAVRRLTPTECERLQGFPDSYTNVPYRGKSAADGPRYKALGNSMAVNCMRVIGQRIEMVASAAVIPQKSKAPGRMAGGS